MAESLEVRMARLEGAYTQITERLGTIEERLVHLETRLSTEITSLHNEFRSEIFSLRSELHQDIIRVESRVNTILYGLIIAILVPIAIRVFFP